MLAELLDFLNSLFSQYSTEILLTLFATATSAIAGILGFGGGMLLIAIMPSFLPAAVIIPIHGIVQLASNSSRVALSLTQVAWHLLPAFLIGSVIGLGLFASLLLNISSDYIPLAIGSYILLNLWSKPFGSAMKQFESFYVIGALQTGLSLIVGATGPLTQSILLKKLPNKDQIIATGAIFMSISHMAKIIVFGFIGFQFGEYLSTLILMSLGAILGSYIGARVRKKVDNPIYIQLVKWLLSLLAFKMIIFVFI
jgi:uncharacterized membrane protein YfcA